MEQDKTVLFERNSLAELKNRHSGVYWAVSVTWNAKKI